MSIIAPPSLNVGIPVASKAQCGDHFRFRRQQFVPSSKGNEQAARGFRFDFAAKRR
jgi:hypothetical protein